MPPDAYALMPLRRRRAADFDGASLPISRIIAALDLVAN